MSNLVVGRCEFGPSHVVMAPLNNRTTPPKGWRDPKPDAPAVRFQSAACDPGTEGQKPLSDADGASAMAREAMVRARAALRTATLDQPKDLEVAARQYVLGRRIAELTEAIAALDLATASKAGA